MSISAQIQAKRDQYNENVKAINHLLSENVNNVWTDELQAKHDSMADDTERLGKQIAALVAAEQRDIEENYRDIDNFRIDPKEKTEKISDSKKAVEIFLRKRSQDMSHDEALLIRNVMSTTTGSEGGFTVQTEVASRLIDAIKEYRFIRDIVSNITTSQGNPLNYPTTDGTTEIGEWVAENAAATTGDISFGTVGLNVFKASSRVVTVPIELLQDSEIDVESLVFTRCGQRIGRLSNAGYTVGTGTGQPRGIMPAASAGVTGLTGTTTTVTYDSLVDLIDSLDIGYQSGRELEFMFNQTSRRVIRKLKDTANRPIWTPSYDAGIAGGFKDQLLGYPVNINNDVAVMAANARSIAFGDFKQYLIRDAMQISLFRFDDSAFMTKGQIGFLAWARTGGNLLDVNAVKVYQNSAT